MNERVNVQILSKTTKKKEKFAYKVIFRNKYLHCRKLHESSYNRKKFKNYKV